MAMKSEEKKGSGGYVPMRELAPTLHYDFQLVVEMSGKLESFRAIRAEVLLLGGSKSPSFLKVALDALEKVLPQAKRVEFPDWVMRLHGIPIEVASRNRWRKNCADFLPDRKIPKMKSGAWKLRSAPPGLAGPARPRFGLAAPPGESAGRSESANAASHP